jgi:hypothetical protein
MPNWVYNGLTVEGSESSVLKLKEQVGKPISVPVVDWKTDELKIETNDNPIFSYWNIIAPTDLDAYPKQTDHSLDKPYAGNDWYSWNNRHWGVKWDASNPYIGAEQANGENYVIQYNFESPWGIPDEALAELSAQYPDLLFTLSYEEETGWGGEHEYLRGERLDGSEYNWQCPECDYMHAEDPNDLYMEEHEELVCPTCQWPVLELMKTPKEEVK